MTPVKASELVYSCDVYEFKTYSDFIDFQKRLHTPHLSHVRFMFPPSYPL